MKIAIVQGAFLPVPPIMGGAVENQWFELGQEFVRRGHQVVHLSRRHAALPVRETIGGVEHVRVGGAAATRSLALLKLRDLLYTLRVARHLPPSQIIVTNTFWAPMLFPALGRGRIYVDFQRMPKGQARLYLHSARLRAPSGAVARAIAEQCPAAAALTRVIPNFVPVSADPVRWEEKEPQVLYAGRVHPEKGLELLLEAFVRLSAREEAAAAWRLSIVGPAETGQGGGGEGYLRALQERFPHPNITWHGAVHERAALHAHYRRASIFCYPSVAEKGETFGVAPLEAMAHGACPVVSSLECFGDFIRDGENGRVFDHRAATAARNLEEVLCGLIRDGATRQTLARRAEGVRQSHDLGSTAGVLLEDFRVLLAGR